MIHRLKSLELVGYKTFASRTLFEFAGTITCIVGPNGSGKSNIADSLRWVLGEQSYALLRGKKTEDMIFSGSESRSRAGMASATILFDNSDGWLPIDFSEVAVTRRAYRDGTNEYLINGQRMRLKDVSELLAQSGLAERTYTIIGQGLVDAALALKAEERRRLFEEAAGIGLHRARREEALRRLDVTRRNLERVQDILAELQPRLRSLERQARRAQEYDQVKADLQVLLRDWYGFHWHRSQIELSEAREFARQQEGVLEKARQENDRFDEKLTGLRDQIQSVRLELNDLHRRSAEFHNQREGLNRDLAVAEERQRSLTLQKEQARSELARLEEEAALIAERRSEADNESERLENELAEAQTQLAAARKALSERQAERGKAEAAQQSARQALSNLNARQGQLQARLSERAAALERNSRSLEAAEKALAGTESERQAAQNLLTAAETTRREAEQARHMAEQAESDHRSQLVLAAQERQKLQDEISGQKADLARRKTQLDVLDGAEKSLTGYAAGSRLLLEEARKANLKAVVGALGAQLEVSSELETAIAASLGEYLDAVVVDAAPDQALDLLLKAATRGVILPMPLIRRRVENHLKEAVTSAGAGILGIASSLVNATSEIRPAVDLLLGATVIVRDRESARQFLEDCPDDFSVRAVTLNGEVFYAGGPTLAGGSGKGSSATTLLGRNRQRKDLMVEIEQFQEQSQEMQNQLAELEKSYQAAQAEAERLTSQARTTRKSAERTTLAVQESRQRIEGIAKQAQWQHDQRDRLQAEIERGDVERLQSIRELESLQGQIDQAREAVRQATRVLEGFSLDEFQSGLAHWNTLAAVAARGLEDLRKRQAEWQSAFDRIHKSQDQQKLRQEDIEEDLRNLEIQKMEKRGLEGEVAREIEGLRVQIEPREGQLKLQELEQLELQKLEAAARQSLTIAESHHASAKIGLARRQESLESLRHRIEDDFGLVAFEYSEEVSGPTPLPLDGMVELLPKVNQLPVELDEAIKRLRAQLRRMGPINPEARAEYDEVKQRFTFMTEQVTDLHRAEEDVRQVIAELDDLMKREFRKTFEAVAVEFKEIFTRLFGGGSARLILTSPDDLTETGIEIEARLPGRRTQGLSLLSGGERSLTAAALVFALLKVSPTPFCVLDEVDAMLDEANVGRFRDLLSELSGNTQFIVVTHNRNTVQAADVIYGVTMGRDSASQVLSLKLDEVDRIVE